MLSRSLHEVNSSRSPAPYLARARGLTPTMSSSLATVSSAKSPPQRERRAGNCAGEAVPEQACRLGKLAVGETAVAAGIEVDELFGLCPDDRGQLIPEGQAAQPGVEAVGAIPGVAQPGEPQRRPGAPLVKQRAHALVDEPARYRPDARFRPRLARPAPWIRPRSPVPGSDAPVRGCRVSHCASSLQA